MLQKILKSTYFHKQKERVSACISRGSLSVEAAFSAPFFLLAMLCIFYLFECISTEAALRAAFYSEAKELAKEAYVGTGLSGRRLEEKIVDRLGRDRLRNSIVVGGSGGIDCSRTHCLANSSILNLSMRYQLEVPVLMFRIPILTREEQLLVKGWTGYEGWGSEVGEKELVYITETGLVYHSTPNCNYLDLSITQIPIEKARKTYAECAMCKKKQGETKQVYVTTYGEAYHRSLNCSGLKRTIYGVKKSEVYGRGGCPKCVK